MQAAIAGIVIAAILVLRRRAGGMSGMRVSGHVHGGAVVMGHLHGTGKDSDAVEHDRQAQQHHQLQTPAAYPLIEVHDSVVIHGARR